MYVYIGKKCICSVQIYHASTGGLRTYLPQIRGRTLVHMYSLFKKRMNCKTFAVTFGEKDYHGDKQEKVAFIFCCFPLFMASLTNYFKKHQ